PLVHEVNVVVGTQGDKEVALLHRSALAKRQFDDFTRDFGRNLHLGLRLDLARGGHVLGDRASHGLLGRDGGAVVGLALLQVRADAEQYDEQNAAEEKPFSLGLLAGPTGWTLGGGIRRSHGVEQRGGKLRRRGAAWQAKDRARSPGRRTHTH